MKPVNLQAPPPLTPEERRQLGAALKELGQCFRILANGVAETWGSAEPAPTEDPEKATTAEPTP